MTQHYPPAGARQRRSRRSLRSSTRRIVAFCALFARPAFAPAHATDPPVTFCKDVAPILQANCQTCHHPGGIAPFSLMTYQDARPMASTIKFFTQRRVMPPWKAVAGYGEFRDERRLTDDQIKTLALWADAGAPEGDPTDLPPTRLFTDGWQLGTPDRVLEPDQPFDVPATGPDIYRAFVLPFHPTQDQWLTAIEVLPGSPSVVHHVLTYLDPLAKSPAVAMPGPEPGFPFNGASLPFAPAPLLDAWAAGATAHFSLPGTAWKIPAGSYLVIDVHYHPNGQPHRDRTRIGLYFARGPIDQRIRITVVGTEKFSIPAGDPHYRVTAAGSFPRDISVLSVWPHMHLLGREMKATATLPAGIAQPMVWIQDWDFHWELSYAYQEPLKLPKGSRIDLDAFYNNSADNPNNPNSPPIVVNFGGRVVDEMCFCYFRYTVDEEHLLQNHPVDNDGIEILNEGTHG